MTEAPNDRPEAERQVRLRVLFLCTHNSARSQVAEALLRALGGDAVESFSAGTEVTRVHPDALAFLGERAVNTDGLYSKHLSRFLDQEFDYVITVCDNAQEQCPHFPGAAQRLHWSLPDPSALADDRARYERFAFVYAELEKRIVTELLARR